MCMRHQTTLTKDTKEKSSCSILLHTAHKALPHLCPSCKRFVLSCLVMQLHRAHETTGAHCCFSQPTTGCWQRHQESTNQ